MFPTCVWRAQLEPEVSGPLNQRVRAVLETMRRAEPQYPLDQPWQSRQDLHQDPDFQELVGHIREAAANVLEYLKVAECEFQFTGGWANMGPPGAAHKLHSHANNFLSCVYYVTTGRGANSITFHDPRFQNQVVIPVVTERTAENAETINMSVEEGTLLLFPSWLPHSVDPNMSGEMRISVSFNMMFSRFAETMAQPDW
jgi:uncharacterized protein (TIGR02466 family)